MKIKILFIIMAATLFSCQASNNKADKDDSFKTPKGDIISIHFIKHASLMIMFKNQSIEIDPVTDLSPKTDYTQMPKAKYIFITHSHYDHFDTKAISDLSTKDTKIILNEDCFQKLHKGLVMKNGDSLILDNDISVKAVPAYNITPGHLQYHPKNRDNGYIIDIEGLRIYIAGDTEDIPEMKDIKDIDIAFLPCNQPYTMTPKQLIRVAKIIKPHVLYPYHYGNINFDFCTGNTNLSSISQALKGSGIDVRIRNLE